MVKTIQSGTVPILTGDGFKMMLKHVKKKNYEKSFGKLNAAVSPSVHINIKSIYKIHMGKSLVLTHARLMFTVPSNP